MLINKFLVVTLQYSFSILEWWSKSFFKLRRFFLFVVSGYMDADFWRFRILWVDVKHGLRCFFFLNILVYTFLFLIIISVSRNKTLSFDISYSNLIDGCFVFYSLKIFSRHVLLSVHIKNILAINLRYISENVFHIMLE